MKPSGHGEPPVQDEDGNDTIHIPDPRSSRSAGAAPSKSSLPALNKDAPSQRNETNVGASSDVVNGGSDLPVTWRKFSPGRPKRSLNKSNIRPSPSPSPALSKSRSKNTSTPRGEPVRSKHSTTGTPMRRVRRRSRQNAPASASATGRHRRVDSGGSLVVPGSPPSWDPGTQADDEEAGHFSNKRRSRRQVANNSTTTSTLPSTLNHKSPGTLRREAKMNGDGGQQRNHSAGHGALSGPGLVVPVDPAAAPPTGRLKLKRLQQLAPPSLSAEHFTSNNVVVVDASGGPPQQKTSSSAGRHHRRSRKEVKYDSPLDRSKRTFGTAMRAGRSVGGGPSPRSSVPAADAGGGRRQQQQHRKSPGEASSSGGLRKVFQLSPKFRQNVFPGFSGDRRRLSQVNSKFWLCCIRK